MSGRGKNRRQADSARVVDANVDATKSRDRGRHGRLHLLFAADIAEQRQGLASGGLDLRGGGMNRAGQGRVRRSVLAATAMFAPSRAARSAIARPMPREAPLIKRVLPRRLFILLERNWPGAVGGMGEVPPVARYPPGSRSNTGSCRDTRGDEKGRHYNRGAVTGAGCGRAASGRRVPAKRL